jgi:hypothetical protein
LPRRRYAGTYDANWQKDVFPFLPEDFDDRYNQCAPVDQQIDFPIGGEDIVLLNMMQDRPTVHFQLPALNKLPIKVLTASYSVIEPDLVVDTLYIEPDAINPDGSIGRVNVVWRASVPIAPPLMRRAQDVITITLGNVCKNWWAAKSVGAEGCMGCSKARSTVIEVGTNPPIEEDCEEESFDPDGTLPVGMTSQALRNISIRVEPQ